MSEATATSTAPSNPTPTASAAPASPGQSTQQGALPAGVITDHAFEALSESDRNRYSRVRAGPDGGSQWQERATLPSETVETTGQPGEQPNAALNPTETYKFGDLELSGQQILDLLKHKGETDLRRAAVPADPSQYKIEAKNVVLPPGMEWRFNEADPALAAARTWAHANELSQDQFSSLLGQYASMEAAKEATFRNAMKAELDKLGANATVRVTALQTWLNGVVGGELAKSMCAGLFSEKQVRGLELLANKFASQGAASFRQDGREPTGQSGRVSEEEYNAMSQGERYAYSKSFDQRQFK
jgi:hypothetical protein